MPKNKTAKKNKRKKSKRKTIRNKSKRGEGGGFFGKKKEATQIEVRSLGVEAKKLECLICSGDKFHTRKSMLRTGRIASFFDTEWLFDKNSTLVICEKCSYIHSFKSKDRIKEIKINS
jgi:hypothetical protein